VISEGSYDTEDWSNDAENSALITGINYKICSHRKQLYAIVIFHNITVLFFFLQINAVLVSRRDFFFSKKLNKYFE